VFWRYSSQIFSALLHYSLAGGFSANRVVGVLRETSYLTGDARDKTYKRLLETTQAIIDYMVGCGQWHVLTPERPRTYHWSGLEIGSTGQNATLDCTREAGCEKRRLQHVR
jgi:hypothetical protein